MRSILASLCFIVSTGFLFGEDELVDIHFSCAFWDRVEDNVVYYRDMGLESRVRVDHMKRSERQHYAGFPQLHFYRKSKDVNQAHLHYPVASAQIPIDTSEDQLFLFYPLAQPVDGKAYGVYRVPDGKEDFSAGSFRILNVSSEELEGEIGKTTFRLAAGDYATVVPAELFDQNKVAVLIRRSGSEGKRKPLFESVWTYHPSTRVLVFAMSSESLEQQLEGENAEETKPLNKLIIRTLDG